MPTFDTPDPISVSVELGVGDVRVVASDRADTVVEVQPSDPARQSDVAAAQRARIQYANGALHVRGPKGWRSYSLRGGSQSIDVLVELPSGSHLHVEAGVAGLSASGTLGDLHHKAGVGDVTVEALAAADVTTGTGTVRIDRIGAAATITNANGDTWIGEAVGDLRVKAANGKIAIGRAHGTVVAKTANGDVHVDEVGRGAVVAETAYGSVDVAVQAGVVAWLDLHTGFGHVHNLLDTTEQPAGSEDTVEVRARSSLGDITVRRADGPERGKGAA